MKKTIEYYGELQYPYLLERDAGTGEWVAVHPDLPGCIASGDTAEEAVASLDEARQLWIETGIELGQHIPEPQPDEFSGRVSLRMPSSLHGDLASIATRRGCSLNLLLNTALAEYVGRHSDAEGLQEVVAQMQALNVEVQGITSQLRGVQTLLLAQWRPPSSETGFEKFDLEQFGSPYKVSTGPQPKDTQGGSEAV